MVYGSALEVLGAALGRALVGLGCYGVGGLCGAPAVGGRWKGALGLGTLGVLWKVDVGLRECSVRALGVLWVLGTLAF